MCWCGGGELISFCYRVVLFVSGRVSCNSAHRGSLYMFRCNSSLFNEKCAMHVLEKEKFRFQITTIYVV